LQPVQRDRVHEIFLKRDLDHSGALDREEFAAVMQVLCGNIFTRVLVQWSLTLMIVPMIAKLILDLITWFFGFVCEQISSLENYDDLETTVSSQVDTIGDWIATTFPALTFAIAAVGDKFSALIDIVPDSIWNTIPVTLVSCMLSIILVPYIIFKIDDFFQALADHKKEEKGQGVATSSS
jgi:ABC-type phosphate transport system permease subunit